MPALVAHKPGHDSRARNCYGFFARRRLGKAAPMTIAVRPLTPHIAGEVSGCDLTKPLSKAEVAAIEAGMDRCAVLVFHDQDVTDEQQVAFTRNFGTIENSYGGHITKTQEKRLGPLVN